MSLSTKNAFDLIKTGKLTTDQMLVVLDKRGRNWRVAQAIVEALKK
ncbi:MAG: hypothetical protein H8D63_02990 [Parcubacteria group bacterium]|nr:hypothetical protein [Parcubacteria group bacterium]